MVQVQNRLFFLLATLLLASVASDAIPGGWQPIDSNSPHVQELGKFAVDEYNKLAGTNLTFESVIKAENKIVAGIFYRMKLTAKNGATSNKYKAIVLEKLDATKNLTSFKPL